MCLLFTLPCGVQMKETSEINSHTKALEKYQQTNLYSNHSRSQPNQNKTYNDFSLCISKI